MSFWLCAAAAAGKRVKMEEQRCRETGELSPNLLILCSFIFQELGIKVFDDATGRTAPPTALGEVSLVRVIKHT